MKDLMVDITIVTILLIMLMGCNSQRGKNIIAGFEMVSVEGGTFDMGEQSSEEGEPDERPVHSVTVSNFYIGKTEVTQKQWYDIMGALPRNLIFGQGDNYPVYNVSRKDIQIFLRKLEKKTGKRFRLPTESEWEYACRGGKYPADYKYSGSNKLNTVGWYCENSGKKRLKDEEYSYDSLRVNDCATHPVRTLEPNELGIYDMSGNVWEWCYDLYGEYSSSSQKNPIEKLQELEFVIRGGGFSDMSCACRISNRGKTQYDTRTCDLGFRLALSE